MKTNVVALFSGLLFGLGLTVSQMINPAKVLAFLDIAGHWDPSLALVMAGALAVMSLAWRLKRLQPGALLHDARLKGLGRVDAPLVIGSALFGAGWGLVGYCPGPAISSLALLSPKPFIFVAAMLAGMALFQLVSAAKNRTRPE